MRVATWNVNSIRARKDRLLRWLGAHAPDVLCLQETKVTDNEFPFADLAALGYRAAAHGQRAYNGVAILARDAITDAAQGLGNGADDVQARLIVATVKGVRVASVYAPNGGEVDSDKWRYKLDWLQRLRRWLDHHHRPGDPLVLAGDFNIAPDDHDVAHPERWGQSVLCHPDGRRALAEVTSFGIVDLLRKHHPAGGIYSWWDYRSLAFPHNDGLRIDLIYATPPVAARCTAAFVDRDERKGKQPSDHAPVVVDLEL